MKDEEKTKKELISELKELRKQISKMQLSISDIKLTEELLHDRERRYNALFEDSRDAIYFRKRDGTIIDANRSMSDLFGYSRDEMIGMNIQDLYTIPYDNDIFQKNIELKGFIKDHEITLKHKNGHEIYCIVTASVLKTDTGMISGYQGIIRDNTERKKVEARIESLMKELHNMSYMDDLTGLYNRRGFFLLSQKQLEMAKRSNKKMFVIFIDVDNLKWINDTSGHQEGDKALVNTANILTNTFREADIIARMGGDEFAIIAMESSEDSENILFSRLQRNIDLFNQESDLNYEISVSIGIAYYDSTKEKTVDEILASADKLMYKHKKSKQNSRAASQ
ncbi:MAG: diguanylate cyclase [Spirochaetota bacterium]|nr:diguanylate cyclase [Spirochaetota bacterium]